MSVKTEKKYVITVDGTDVGTLKLAMQMALRLMNTDKNIPWSDDEKAAVRKLETDIDNGMSW